MLYRLEAAVCECAWEASVEVNTQRGPARSPQEPLPLTAKNLDMWGGGEVVGKKGREGKGRGGLLFIA